MTNTNRIKIGIIAAALGLSGMSSNALAQPGGDPYECEDLAWRTCNPDFGPWDPWKYWCWWETYEACIAGVPGPYGSLMDGDLLRPDIQQAAAVTWTEYVKV